MMLGISGIAAVERSFIIVPKLAKGATVISAAMPTPRMPKVFASSKYAYVVAKSVTTATREYTMMFDCVEIAS
jgi:hypothetical protein